MSTGPRGVVAAGHPQTAEAGAGVLRAGGNAVDAAVAAMLASWAAEPVLTGPAIALAREGALVTEAQAYILEILVGIIESTPECRALLAPGGRVPREGDTLRNPDLADALERLGADGAAPFYTGDIGQAVS